MFDSACCYIMKKLATVHPYITTQEKLLKDIREKYTITDVNYTRTSTLN